MKQDSRTVRVLDYHRNGMCGLGFHVAIVDEVEQGQTREMLVIRFPSEADKDVGAVLCAAFDLAKLDEREVRFFHNSWRGDHYADVMDRAINDAATVREKKYAEDQAIYDLTHGGK